MAMPKWPNGNVTVKNPLPKYHRHSSPLKSSSYGTHFTQPVSAHSTDPAKCKMQKCKCISSFQMFPIAFHLFPANRHQNESNGHVVIEWFHRVQSKWNPVNGMVSIFHRMEWGIRGSSQFPQTPPLHSTFQKCEVGERRRGDENVPSRHVQNAGGGRHAVQSVSCPSHSHLHPPSHLSKPCEGRKRERGGEVSAHHLPAHQPTTSGPKHAGGAVAKEKCKNAVVVVVCVCKSCSAAGRCGGVAGSGVCSAWYGGR